MSAFLSNPPFHHSVLPIQIMYEARSQSYVSSIETPSKDSYWHPGPVLVQPSFLLPRQRRNQADYLNHTRGNGAALSLR